MIDSTTNDQQLLELAKNGHAEAVSLLYRKYVDAVYRFCYWQTNQRAELAEDLTQDTFVEMVKSLSTWRGQGSFRNWLYTIAKRQIARWLRKQYQLPTTPLFDQLPQPEELIDPQHQQRRLNQVSQLLESLPETESQVLQLRYLNNYSVAEVAKKLELSVSNVKVIAHRALKKLKGGSE